MKKIILGIFAFAFSITLITMVDTANAAKADPWTLVESLSVQANTLNPVYTTNNLENGAKYKIVVKGTYIAGDDIEADAKCSYRFPTSTEWTDSVNNYESYGPLLLDLNMNGESVWGDECNPNHEYSTTIIGDGAKLNFYIYDIYSVNNTGKLDVEIYKFWKNPGVQANACTTIQSGNLVNSVGAPITTGYDQWGYNYQARLFNGTYCDSYRDAPWCHEYADINLSMKWNDAWLSNKSCDTDGLLDRHYGFSTYKGSGAWLTNHMSGVNSDGSKWTYFTKIVAVPLDAINKGGTWYTAEGVKIGPAIWGDFATVQTVSNDPSNGEHGLLYKSPFSPGFGQY